MFANWSANGLRLAIVSTVFMFAAAVVGVIAARPVGAETHKLTAQELVQVVNFSFTPITTTINAGDSVQWQLIEGLHNVDADDGSFTSGEPSASWGPYSHTFDMPGIYLYHCEVHGAPGGVGMSGVVVVQGELRRIYLPVALTS